MQPNKNELLHVSNLKFKWSPETPLLDILSFRLHAQEKVFLFGPSGSGKTTFLNILTGVLSDYTGSIDILGKKMDSLCASQRDQFRGDHMGFIFQQFNLIPYLNVLENIMLPLNFSEHKRKKIQNTKEEAQRLARHLNLQDHLHKAAAELSVGQQQRVAAARALIGAPELIIADEPTSSLDYDHRDQFLKLLFDEVKNSKSTLLFVSHDKTLQTHFDRSLSLSDISKGAL